MAFQLEAAQVATQQDNASALIPCPHKVQGYCGDQKKNYCVHHPCFRAGPGTLLFSAAAPSLAIKISAAK